MDNCSTNSLLHQVNSASQNQRGLDALNPGFFSIDERNEIDLIHLTQKLAKNIIYFDSNNTDAGDWSSFFNHETTGVLVHFYKWDIDAKRTRYDEIKKGLINLSISDQKETLLNYFFKLRSSYNELFEKVKLIDPSIEIREYFVSTAEALQKIFNAIFDEINTTTNFVQLVHQNSFNVFVQQLFGILHTWKTISEQTLKNVVENFDAHSPQMTLFIAFLKMYGVAQKQLNEFTARHLDFYYKDILQLKNQKAKPDYAHLLIETTPNKSVLVTQNTVFRAGKNTLGKNKFYASTADQVVNGIQFKTLLSSYTDAQNVWNKADLTALNTSGNGFDVFKSVASTFQTELIISSPLFYLKGGVRKIKLTLDDLLLDSSKYQFFVTSEKGWLEVFSETDFSILIPAKEKPILPYNSSIHKGVEIQTPFPAVKIIPRIGIPSVTCSQLQIVVQVNDLTDFLVTSDTGIINHTKPFYPFGEFPKKGNGMMISCNEFFQKNGAVLQNNLPLAGIDTNAFVLNDGVWKPIANGDFSNGLASIDYFQKEEEINPKSKNGYLRFEFNEAENEPSFLKKYINAATTEDIEFPSEVKIPSLALNYTVTDHYSAINIGNNLIELFHVLPFGYQETNLMNPLTFPLEAPEKGEIYLGFENAIPNQNLSFLIQFADGTANPKRDFATVTWSFLNQNTWVEFESQQITDETMGLTLSGIVNCKIPEFETTQTTIMNPSLFWIKVTVDVKDAICHFIGVHAQAIKVVLSDYEKTGISFLENTSKETITKLVQPIDDIKKIMQPYPSFDGKEEQNQLNFYTSASERLRHKSRAITSWDYERLILNEFPEVFRVKCLNHYRLSQTISNSAAGYVTIIPIAKSRNDDNPISWKPLVSQGVMKQIKAFLIKVSSPHARILVKSPSMEKIVIKCNVKFKDIPGSDSRLFTEKLIASINEYLCPWIADDKEIQFTGKIEISDLIQLIDNQSFVDFISDFKVDKIIVNPETDQQTTFYDVKEIVPQTDFTLFMPNENHQITEITTQCC